MPIRRPFEAARFADGRFAAVLRLVFVAMAAPGAIFHAWMCDCVYRKMDQEFRPPELISDIVRAREWDDGGVAFDLTKL